MNLKEILQNIFSVRNVWVDNQGYKSYKIFGYEYKKCFEIVKIKYNHKRDALTINTGRNFYLRLRNSTFLFMKAFDKVRNRITKDFVFKLYCNDFIQDNKRKLFAESSNGAKNIILVPDSFFIGWEDAKIHDYDSMCKEIENASTIPPIYNQCFWAGNLETFKTRKVLYEKFKGNNKFKLISMGWQWKEINGKLENVPSEFVSLPEHTKYKYLLDLRGHGWSGRLKFLLFTNRPILLVERDYVDYFTPMLEPFVHYVPVKNDLSNLEEMYDWLEANPEKAKQIAQNALNFAKVNLTQEAVVEYYSQVILKYAQEGWDKTKDFVSNTQNKHYNSVCTIRGGGGG